MAEDASSSAGYRLGVDLGTTYTAAAINRNGVVSMATLGLRQPEIPSVIAITDDGIIIGDAAERRALLDPGSIAREFKRRIGDTTPLIVNTTPWSAEALTARLLDHVLTEVKASEGQQPDEIVVTHPANWHEFKLDRLRQALLMAGCEEALLLPEPVAAAHHYARQGRISPGQHIAVFDFGGGTLDTAVIHATGNHTFELIGQPKGLEHLGGIDFDHAVLSHVLIALDLNLEELEDTPENRQAVARLRQDCREAKEHLSVDAATAIPVMLPGIHTQVRLTRVEFEEMIRPRLADATRLMATTIDTTGLHPADIDAVLLVGGTSRIPTISQHIGEQLQLPVLTDAHPKHTIAIGATYAESRPEPAVSTERPHVDAPPTEPPNEPTPVAPVEDLETDPVTDPEPAVTATTNDQPPSLADSEEPPPFVVEDGARSERSGARRLRLALLAVLAAIATGVSIVAFNATNEGADLDIADLTYAVTDTILVGAGPVTPTFAADAIWVPNHEGTTVSRIDPGTREVTDTITVGSAPWTPLFADEALWVPNSGGNAISRINPTTGNVTDTITVGGGPWTPTYAADALWVPNRRSGTVSRIDPGTSTVTDTITVGAGPVTPLYAADALWVPNHDGTTVSRIDPATNTVTDTITVGAGPETPLYLADAIWVPNHRGATIAIIDPETNTVSNSMTVWEHPWGPLDVDGDIWISNYSSRSVSRIDPVTYTISATIDVGAGPSQPVMADGAIWVSHIGGATISRINPDTNEVAETIPVQTTPERPIFADGAIWVSNFSSGTVSRIDRSS